MLDARFVRENPEAVRTAMANRHCEWDSTRSCHSTKSGAS